MKRGPSALGSALEAERFDPPVIPRVRPSVLPFADILAAVPGRELQLVTRLNVALDIVEEPLGLGLVDAVPVADSQDDLALLVPLGVLEGRQEDCNVDLIVMSPRVFHLEERLERLILGLCDEIGEGVRDLRRRESSLEMAAAFAASTKNAHARKAEMLTQKIGADDKRKSELSRLRAGPLTMGMVES